MRATTIIGACVLGAVLLAAPVRAGEIVEGVLTAVYAASLQIDGRTYPMTDATVCQDKSGGRVAPDELRPGAGVEAEIDDGGALGVVTVDLVR